MTEQHSITLANRASTMNFVPKMRIEWRPHAPWHVRAWRWITKDNWRVRAVDYDNCIITVECCR